MYVSTVCHITVILSYYVYTVQQHTLAKSRNIVSFDADVSSYTAHLGHVIQTEVIGYSRQDVLIQGENIMKLVLF